MVILFLLCQIYIPKPLTLVATSDNIIVKNGMLTFTFDPPIDVREGTYRILRINQNGKAVSLRVYATTSYGKIIQEYTK